MRSPAPTVGILQRMHAGSGRYFMPNVWLYNRAIIMRCSPQAIPGCCQKGRRQGQPSCTLLFCCSKFLEGFPRLGRLHGFCDGRGRLGSQEGSSRCSIHDWEAHLGLWHLFLKSLGEERCEDGGSVEKPT